MNEASRYFSAASGEASPLEAGVCGRLPAYVHGLVPAFGVGGKGALGEVLPRQGIHARGWRTPAGPAASPAWHHIV